VKCRFRRKGLSLSLSRGEHSFVSLLANDIWRKILAKISRDKETGYPISWETYSAVVWLKIQ
jgi:hypothetical protein